MSVRIFAMTHKRFDVPNDPMYIPLHVGHAGAKEDFGYQGDDTGDNISAQNCYYAELSGIYWVWKNFHGADYVGVCHYRRFLTSEEGYVFSEAEYERLLREYDIITTRQLELPGSYHHGFSAHHGSRALDETGAVIRERQPQYYEAFLRLVHGNKTYFGNIMAASKALFDEYAAWLFDILFALQERIDLSFADDYHRRVFGFISEFLLYVWVTVRGLRAYECRVAIIGEKTETREIKERMADFFRERDARGAKAYFAECLKVRPDVLMEASDITGECKLCLQAVSTANLELDAYGHCFLERINDYDAVIRFFRGINDAALCIVKGGADGQYADWLRQNRVSGIALRAAVRIHAPDDETLQRAYQDAERIALPDAGNFEGAADK